MRRTLNRSDFLAQCKASDSRNRSLEEIRDKGAEVILSVFRLLKNSLVHAIDNQAVALTAKESHALMHDFAGLVGGYVSITFVDETIFVCGQLLRASRSIYQSAMEVGRLLATCNVSELSYTGEVTVANIMELCQAFATASRDPAQRNALLEAKLTNVAVRAVDSSLQNQKDEDAELPPMERALRTYASGLVVMRQYFDKVSRGRTVLPHRVKRIAQRLVALVEGDESALLSMLTLANAHRDEAGRALQTAILMLAVSKKLTSDRSVLAQLAMAALTADIGRARVAGGKSETYVALSDESERIVPALTGALCITSGGVNVQNALRTVATFEATSLERQHVLGPLYRRQMSPLIQSKLLHLVRALLDLMAPRDITRPMSALDALAAVSRMPTADPMLFKLLVQALGVMPTGTVVEFETGEWGVVVGPSQNRAAVGRPRIKLVTDHAGNAFPKPKELDLGTATATDRYPRIRGVIEPNRARFNVTAVLLADVGTTTQAGTA